MLSIPDAGTKSFLNFVDLETSLSLMYHILTSPLLILCVFMVVGMLLIIAGDVELNPGPRSDKRST